MHTQFMAMASPTQANVPPDTRLQGRGRWLVQLMCALVAGLALTFFLSSLPADFDFWRTVCNRPMCVSGQISAVGAQVLRSYGLSMTVYAGYLIGINVTLATVFTLSALVIVIRKPNDWLALFVAVMLVTFGTITFSDTLAGLNATYPGWWVLTRFVAWFGDVAIMLFLFIFPTGQFVPRWTRFVLVLWGLMQGLRLFGPDTVFNLQHTAPLIYNILFPAGVFSGIFAQVYRYRWISGPAQRQQTKWVVFSVAIALGGVLLVFVPFRGLQTEEHLLVLLTVATIQALFILLIPISIAVAVVRYRLWEIDPIINRTLVYGALTISVVGLYVVIVGALGALFQARGNFFISVLATGLAAIIFEPLRARLQRGANRLMYGERDDPYVVVARLGQRLESTLAPEAVLPTIVETVAQALKLPYAGIAVSSDQAIVTSAEWRRDPGLMPEDGSLITLPLTYQGETIGQLQLAPRAPGETFSPADHRLLQDLAHQAGVAAHAVRLTRDLQQLNTDLQRSREQIITAREEERRRLRRDLHDGLGPQLASQALKLEAIRDLIRARPARAEQLVDDLIDKSQETIADVRRLVYGLRPPALDEFGLMGAIREYARQCEIKGVRITVAAPEQLPPLPAAVEVAAYRIVQEALTNVIRHAQAQTVVVNVTLAEAEAALHLAISDDGTGLSPTHHPGVGLNSMRERAAELGGDCTIETQTEGGTRVFAQLPLNKEFKIDEVISLT
ncbi:MAG: GAF domain-containing sensor histidine kinase [Chloroflexi bacterium]|nr:GAF domain-containing sensor histidine kinase [Chloroflexota bacterium]